MLTGPIPNLPAGWVIGTVKNGLLEPPKACLPMGWTLIVRNDCAQFAGALQATVLNQVQCNPNSGPHGQSGLRRAKRSSSQFPSFTLYRWAHERVQSSTVFYLGESTCAALCYTRVPRSYTSAAAAASASSAPQDSDDDGELWEFIADLAPAPPPAEHFGCAVDGNFQVRGDASVTGILYAHRIYQTSDMVRGHAACAPATQEQLSLFHLQFLTFSNNNHRRARRTWSRCRTSQSTAFSMC